MSTCSQLPATAYNPRRIFRVLVTGWLLLGMSLFGGLQVTALWSGNGIKTAEPGSGLAQTVGSGEGGETIAGKVIDIRSRKPIEGATVFHSGTMMRTGSDGTFRMCRTDPLSPLLIKAPGYHQTSILQSAASLEVALKPLQVRGLYLTHYGVGYKPLRDRAYELIRSSELNAVVIDVKGDRGLLSSKYEVPLAYQIGATKVTTVKDIRALVGELHRQDVYVIGRIVVFKDDILAHAKPELAIIDTRTKAPWLDNEHLAWVDPFRREVWSYNIAIAVEAAKAGFDEIQFDYVRFPTDGRLSSAKYSQPNTMENRVKTINALLATARQALDPLNVYFSADLFGYTPWNYNDTDIGQKIEDVANYVDYICLMVYPSGYHLGIPGYLQPVAHPYEVVYNTLEKAKKRLGGQEKKLRPWLQNFRDYAFDRRPYTGTEIKLQIEACIRADTNGYLLWDPSNRYKYTDDAMNALKNSTRASAGKPGRGQPGAQ